MIDGERPRQGDEALQIGKGELDAVGIEPAGHRDAAPERAHDLFVQQGQQGRAEPFEDDETQRIRADIDDRDAISSGLWTSIGHRRAYGAAAAEPCRGRTGWDLS